MRATGGGGGMPATDVVEVSRPMFKVGWDDASGGGGNSGGNGFPLKDSSFGKLPVTPEVCPHDFFVTRLDNFAAKDAPSTAI